MASVPVPIFKSCYSKARPPEKYSCTYPIGMDPIWSASVNELIFFNSYKMKFAILVAVVHIFLGIVLKGINSIYFCTLTVFFCEVIPEILFTLAVVGYLAFMIVYKWAVSWPAGSSPPSLLTMLFEVFMNPGGVPKVSMFDIQVQQTINSTLFCN